MFPKFTPNYVRYTQFCLILAEIGDRKKKRLKKAQDEKIRERRITEEENQKIYQKLPEVDIGLKSKVQFPCFFNSTPIPGLEIQTEVEETQASGSNWRNSGPTFAKVLLFFTS